MAAAVWEPAGYGVVGLAPVWLLDLVLQLAAGFLVMSQHHSDVILPQKNLSDISDGGGGKLMSPLIPS